MPAREINPFTALTRIRSQFLRTQWSTSNHQRVDTTTPQTAQPSGWPQFLRTQWRAISEWTRLRLRPLSHRADFNYIWTKFSKSKHSYGLLEFNVSLSQWWHIETMPAREMNPFTALTRIRSQFLRTQWSMSNHQRVDMTTPQTAQPSGLTTNCMVIHSYGQLGSNTLNYVKRPQLRLHSTDKPRRGQGHCAFGSWRDNIAATNLSIFGSSLFSHAWKEEESRFSWNCSCCCCCGC